MAKTTTFVFLTLCAVFSVEYVAAFNGKIPAGFYSFDNQFQLKPYKAENKLSRYVFKFGDQQQRDGEPFESTTKELTFRAPQDVDIIHGFPKMFDGGIGSKVAYAEITITTDDGVVPEANFVHYRNKLDFMEYFYFRSNVKAKNVSKIKYEINVYGSL